jgi:hypothetical protein
LAVNSVVVCSSSTQSAAARMLAWVRESMARWNARSWAVQYGHHAPRLQNDSELADERGGNLDGLRAGNVQGQLGKRVARVQPGHGLSPYECRRVNLSQS